MFLLDTDRIPATPLEITNAIAKSLGRWIRLPSGTSPVTCTGNLPNLSSFIVDVSGGLIASADSLPFESADGDSLPGPAVEDFKIIGHPISIADVPIQLDLTGQHATFAYTRNATGKLIANLKGAATGQLLIQLRQSDLESAALAIARHFAGDKITIQKVDVALTSISPTDLNVLLTITAKKFVTAIVKVSGRISIDSKMTGKATDLRANADGMVGNIAVAILQPHLQKLEGQPIPLLAFPLGNVKLRGIEIHTTDGLKITAAFGSEPA